MKKIIQTVLAVVVIINMTGCATPCMIDRRRDTADIFMASYGVGWGLMAQVGPVQTGLYVNDGELGGLRGGICELFNPMSLIDDEIYVLYGRSNFIPCNTPVRDRNKVYYAARQTGPLTFLHLSGGDSCPYYYTQMQISVGLYRTIRLGFNPGELLDFTLGWFGIDIFKDDLEAKKQKEKATKHSPVRQLSGCRPVNVIVCRACPMTGRWKTSVQVDAEMKNQGKRRGCGRETGSEGSATQRCGATTRSGYAVW
jgi:hypothetical protein